MALLKDDFQGYRKMRQDWDDLVESRKIALDTAYEGIRARIQAGETTGDRILDFCIVKFGQEDLTAPFLHDVESRMQGKVGEPVLLVERAPRPFCPDPVGGTLLDYRSEWRLHACILTDEALVLDSESFGFSSLKHGEWQENRHSSEDIVIKPGTLFPSYCVLYMAHLLPSQEQSNFILIGKAEIEGRMPELLQSENALEAQSIESALKRLLAAL